ncbi:MAG: hypothetical protein ABI443_02545 [Chthoniobacterales bacterium]
MKKSLFRLSLLLLPLSLWAKPLVIHEWGTFTVFQNEQGEAIRGINTDDEPVPSFVHRAALGIQKAGAVQGSLQSKGLIACHPDVTMRLETPIVYFYPPNQDQITLDFTVTFPRGLLTEYYPDANVFIPGFNNYRLKPEICGKLEWKDLHIGGKEAGPNTDSEVWTTPRAVDAASVTTSKGEKERYLFYRGVAHLNSPLRVVRNGEHLVIQSQKNEPLAFPIPTKAWLADLRANGTAAFRELILDGSPRSGLATTSANFSPEDYSVENEARLRQSMTEALIKDGLFPKEAEAMLKTWELSYFQSAGVRLFYLVPREWTEEHLPLHVSVEAEITRVMIGRIEIMTPYQRHLLDVLEKKESAFDAGNIPAAYYLLGRFANALILDELQKHPTEKLKEFVHTYSGIVGGQYPVNP